MRRGYLVNYVVVCGAVFIILNAECNRVPDSVTQVSSSFIHNQSEKIFRIDSLFLFNVRENYQVDFYGIKTCTLTTHGAVTSTTTDSLYYRITCLGDTVLIINDSVYGSATFQMGDILSWDVFLRHCKDSLSFLGRAIINQCTNDEVNSITSYTLSSEMPDSIKSSLLGYLNTLLDSLDFYHTHKEEINDDIFFIDIQDSLHNDVNRLVEKGIMLDSTGTVKSQLSLYEREQLRWFNWILFTQYIDNEHAAEDFGKAFQKYSTGGRIYTLRFQQGPAQSMLHTNTVYRFFIVRHTGMFQVALSDKFGFRTVTDRTILDYPIMTDTSLNVTQLFFLPQTPFITEKEIEPFFLQGYSVVKYSGMSVDGFDSTWSYKTTCYFPLSGDYFNAKQPVHIAGSVVLTINSYKYNYYMTHRDQAYFTDWKTVITVAMIQPNGDVTSYREHHYLQSDDG